MLFFLEQARKLRAPTPPRLSKDVSAEQPPKGIDPSQLVAHLSIPCPDRTEEDATRERHRLRGQFLARQDRWSDLSDEIRRADSERALTPAGLPVAELLCYGARADVVSVVDHVLIGGKPERGAPLLDGIEALEEMLAEVPDDPVRAVIVAQAHMDVGWSWRRSAGTAAAAVKNRAVFEAHFDRASDILSQYGKSYWDSHLFLSARCALNAGGLARNARLEQDYECLIDLAPKAPAPMRALGNYLSPRWYGSHDALELEARRTAARTQEIWGAGGYTWVMVDALAHDGEACARLDLDFFLEGLRDIMERTTEQHTANTLAAYCAVTLGNRRFECGRAEHARRKISDAASWIVKSHVTELHPMIWAHAAAGFDNSLRVPSNKSFAAAGRRDGLHKIAEVFRAEIENGQRIVFTAHGPVAESCG